jgi:hypothetical protein
MLSTENRIKLQEIANKIAKGEEVSLSESVLIHKWADNNRSVYEMLRRAKREAFYGESEKSSMDQFLHDLNLGDPDPSTHRSKFDGPDDLGDFFKAPYWTRRD